MCGQEVDPPAAQSPAREEAAPAADNTTLLHNDEESFALAPVDATVLKGNGTHSRQVYGDRQNTLQGMDGTMMWSYKDSFLIKRKKCHKVDTEWRF